MMTRRGQLRAKCTRQHRGGAVSTNDEKAAMGSRNGARIGMGAAGGRGRLTAMGHRPQQPRQSGRGLMTVSLEAGPTVPDEGTGSAVRRGQPSLEEGNNSMYQMGEPKAQLEGKR